jgi:Papain family cysteine protease/CARDB
MPWVDLDLSEQIVLSCSGAGDCEKGGSAAKAADFLRDRGTYRESCYRYTAADGDCNQACANWQTYPYKIDGWSFVVAGQSADVSAIKNALYSNGPLVAWMKIYEDFRSYGGGVYSYTTGNYTGTNHFVLIVGWDDGLHALKCKNSWGTSWGDSGFFWIDYKELYGTGTTEFGKSVYAFGEALFVSPPAGPDLRGEWTSFTQTCKTSPRGQTCKISATLQVNNTGSQAVSSYVEIYLSDGMAYLKRISTGRIKVGGSKSVKITCNLPRNQSASGKQLMAVIDPDDTLVEKDEKNNVIASGVFQ